METPFLERERERERGVKLNERFATFIVRRADNSLGVLFHAKVYAIMYCPPFINVY